MPTQTDDIAGWYFTIKYTEAHEPDVVKTYPCHFMNPDSNVGAVNVRSSFELWNPRATIISIEHGAPKFKTLGWGDGAWTQAFK